MKLANVGLALFLCASPALADCYRSGDTRTCYDVQSGNQYETTIYDDGSSDTEADNINTGAHWTIHADPDGNTDGIDKNGNAWSGGYDADYRERMGLDDDSSLDNEDDVDSGSDSGDE